MTDSSVLLPNSTAVSSDCLYNLKPSAVRSRSYRASIPTSNKSTFNPGDTMIFYVPGGRKGNFLDCTQSYIRYTVKNNDATANNTIIFDGCGASIINRLDTFHGSNLLESVQQYNALYNYILDFQMNIGARQGLATMYGMDQTNTVSNVRTGVNIPIGNSATVCMPLLSGVVGLGIDKMLPIGQLIDDIRLEITLESNLQGMVWTSTTTTTNWTVVSAELELCIVELSDEGQNMVNSVSSPDRPLYLHGQSYRHYTSNLPATSQGGYSTLVPARFASLKSLVLLPRRNTEVIGATSYSMGSRVNPCLSTYWWRVGASIIPNKVITLDNANSTGGFAEAFAETIKSWHGLNSYYVSTSVIGQYYNTCDSTGGGFANTPVQAISTGANSYKNGFAIGQELESFANRGDVLLCGLNTLSSQVFFEANLNTAVGAVSYVLDFYALYDHILVLENGILSVRF
jgi:hypothetical protein